MAHLEHVAFRENQSITNAAKSSLMEERLTAVAAPLVEVCRDIAASLDHHSAATPPPSTPLSFDRGMPPTAYTLGADLLTPIDEGAIASLSHSLAQWLEDPSHPPSASITRGPMPIPEEFLPHGSSKQALCVILCLLLDHCRWFVHGRPSCAQASRDRRESCVVSLAQQSREFCCLPHGSL